jgi:hypothetical protein
MTNAKGTRSVTRGVLTLKESLAVSALAQSSYKELGLSNIEFAKHANSVLAEKLRFPLNEKHIRTVLLALEIPGNMQKKKSDDVGECLGLTVRVQALEEQLQKLTTFIKSTAIFHK